MTTLETGPYAGHRIRTARVPHTCENAGAHDAGNAPSCSRRIASGERYVETECDPYSAGGFGMRKMCLPCAQVGDPS